MFAFIFSVSSHQTDKVPPGLAFSVIQSVPLDLGYVIAPILIVCNLSHIFDINSISLQCEYGEGSYVSNKLANKLRLQQQTSPTYTLLQRCGWILCTERKSFRWQEPKPTPTISSYLLTIQEDTRLVTLQVVVYKGTITCQLG